MLQGTGYLRRELVETGTPRGRTARILYDAEHNWQRRTGRVCGRVTGLALRVLRFNCASHSLACGRVRMEAPLISSGPLDRTVRVDKLFDLGLLRCTRYGLQLYGSSRRARTAGAVFRTDVPYAGSVRIHVLSSYEQ